MNVLLRERENEEKTAKGEGTSDDEITSEAEGKTVDYAVLTSNEDENIEHTETEEPTNVEEKLKDMEERLNIEMKDQMQDIHNMLASLLNAQASQASDIKEPERSNSPVDSMCLPRTFSTGSLSNKSTRELKKKFEIIVKEIKIELKTLGDAMKEESGSPAAVKVGIECLKSKEDRCGRLIDKYAGIDEDEEELNNMIEHWLELQNESRKIKTLAQDYLSQMRRKEDAEKRIKENVRLPKLQVKEFRGDPLEWPNWYSSFKRCVHDNKPSTNQLSMII